MRRTDRVWAVAVIGALGAAGIGGCEGARPLDEPPAAASSREALSVDIDIPAGLEERLSPSHRRPPTHAEYEAEFQTRARFLLDEAADHYHPPGLPTAVSSADPSRPYFRLLYPAPDLHRNVRQYVGHDPFRCCSDPQKYFWPLVLARLAKYPGDPEANHWVRRLAEMQADDPANNLPDGTIVPDGTKRYPFHFAFPGLARLLHQFGAESEVAAHEVTHLRQVWERDDFFNAFDGEGTENHVAMSRTSAYLLLERMQAHPTVFPPDRVQARLSQMRQWIRFTANRLYQTGPGEWDSNTYAVHTVASFINLYDFAKDAEIRDFARAVIDFYAVALALKHTHGVVGGASMRGGELVSTSSDTGYLSWLWFGDTAKTMAPPTALLDAEGNSTRLVRSVSGNGFTASVSVALSRYRPPRLTALLARKQLTVPATYFNSKGAMLMESKLIKEVFHIGAGYTLGSTMSPYGGFTGGDTQTLNWKLTARATAAGAPSALTVTGNGGTRPGTGGQGRTPWDQLVQHENVLFQLSRVPANGVALTAEALDRIDAPSALTPADERADDDWRGRWERDMLSRFFPSRTPESWERPENLVTKAPPDPTATWSYVSFPETGVTREPRGDIFFIDLQGTYVAVRALRSTSFVEEAAGTGRKLIKDAARTVDGGPLYDQLFGFVLEVGSAAEHGTFAAFAQAIESRTRLDRSALDANVVTYTSLSGDVIEARYESRGTFTEPIYSWGFGPTTRQVILRSPPFLQPAWPQGEGHGRIASHSVNGRPVRLDREWPLYAGPHLFVDKGQLRLSAGPYQHRVTFVGGRPHFFAVH